MYKTIGAGAGVGLVVMIAMASFAQDATPGAASFNEVWAVVTEAPDIESPRNLEERQIVEDIEEYGTISNPTLPQFSGLTELGGAIISGALRTAAHRTVESHADYRPYLRKLVHGNGTCFSGKWEITAETAYTGLFKKGSSALMIGRISAATPQTTNDGERAFGFAGKLFPTSNPEEVVPTANFFTVDNLNSTNARQVLSVAYVNEPPLDLSGFFNPLRVLINIFAAADINPHVRPLYPISQAGLAEPNIGITPKWMRIRTAPGVRKDSVRDSDFRNELSPRNYPNGLVFTIEVSDTTKDPLAGEGWTSIGQIRTSPMVTTFGCDRRLHFAHPAFRNPRLDN